MPKTNTVDKLKIGVFMGGKSIEREVSFNSGRTICDHLDTKKYNIIPIFQTEEGDLYILPWHFLHRGKISDFRQRLKTEAIKIKWGQLKATVDFIYLAVHGRFCEDGAIQGMLEVLGVPYLGTKVFGSALGMDKVMQKEIFKANNIKVPNGIIIKSHKILSLTQNYLEDLLKKEKLIAPFIVKPSHEGSSLGIQCVSDTQSLMSAILSASQIDSRITQDVLIEEKITGMEFVCVALEKITQENGNIKNEWFTLPITEVIPEENTQIFDYEQKYMPGRATKITPARCCQEDQARIAHTVINASNLLNFSTISRIDGFLTPTGEIYLIDPNTLTGMSPATFLFHQAAEVGMSHTDLINYLIETELTQYGFNTNIQSIINHKGDQMSQDNKKIRVAVLLGGDSNEREISLESGRNVCYKLSPHKYDITPIFINNKMELYKLSQKLLIKNSTKDITPFLQEEFKVDWEDLKSLADFIFLALHGGKGENGSIQGTLEMLELPYNGSGVLASALCMDKFKTNSFLKSHGFDIPNSILISKTEWLSAQVQEQKDNLLDTKLKDFKFPLVLKPNDDGCSIMISKVISREDLELKLNEFFTSDKKFAMIEEMITGTELTCGVIGNTEVTALPPSQAVAKSEILSIEEKFLPGAGENQTPAPLPHNTLEFIKEIMKDVYITIGCRGYSRIDCFYQDEQQSPTGKHRVIILEINTLPALTPATCLFHQVAEIGLKPMDLIDKIIDFGLQNHKEKISSPSLALIYEKIEEISQESKIIDTQDTLANTKEQEEEQTKSKKRTVKRTTVQCEGASDTTQELLDKKDEDLILKLF
jgi:D-alanine--D-alanine ligase